MKIVKKIFIALVCVALMVGVSFCLFLWLAPYDTVEASDYTDEQHLKRISKLVKKRFINDEYGFTGYDVYPMYNENDKMKYALVEFQPTGFVCVQINKSTQRVSYGTVSMYMLDTHCDYRNIKTWTWRRYLKPEDPDNQALYPESRWKLCKEKGRYFNDICEVDESGAFIDYTDSPFKVAGMKDEKRYLLKNGKLSIKKEDVYFNLISMEDISADYLSSNIPGIPVYFMWKSIYNL